MNFLQGLGGIGAGLITANQLLRQQKQDEINNKYRTAMTGLADAQLSKINKEAENSVAYGAIADQNQPGTQTIARANAPVDEWGNPEVETIAKPGDRLGAFDKMAAEALKRGDREGYAKFVQFGDTLKKHSDEGITDIAKMINIGAVDPAAAEKSFNLAGQMRVVPGSTKWDADTGVLSGIDASTGQQISMDRQAAQRHLVMTGAIKPDEYASAGDGQVFNKRTGVVSGSSRSAHKPIVVNGSIFEQQDDGNGGVTYKKVAEAPKQASIVVHQNSGGGGGGPSLTTTQQRSNEEINAARQALTGMSRDDVLRKTQQATATGRNNPDYDPQLASQWKLANRRKYGDDTQFDQFNTPTERPNLGNDLRRMKQQTDIAKRMSADPAMKGMRAGKITPQGLEVLDTNGRIVGHYN